MRSRRSFPAALVGLLLFALAAGAYAQADVPIPAPPQRWLTDAAAFLTPAAAAELDARLEEFARASGRQFIVYIADSTGGIPIEDWAVRAFASWKVGRKGLDDGLALFIMASDRRLRIEVGYGLEGVLPDALAGRILNDEMAPRLQQGDNDGAVRAAVERLIAVVSGDDASGGSGEEREAAGSRPLTLFQKVLIGIGVLFFLVLLITNPSLALYLLFTILSGGRGGGGGGGFSGGGGRSGGGGASGGW
ncbi:MAG: TPM domain-containing protein [Candidatus Aminicenantes bacterium]|nr:TPM domain-containing protein [Candidatus Aminicenantes bacterium]